MEKKLQHKRFNQKDKLIQSKHTIKCLNNKVNKNKIIWKTNEVHEKIESLKETALMLY